MVLKVWCPSRSPEGLLKHRLNDSLPPKVSDPVGLGGTRGSAFLVSFRAIGLVQGTHFENSSLGNCPSSPSLDAYILQSVPFMDSSKTISVVFHIIVLKPVDCQGHLLLMIGYLEFSM